MQMSSESITQMLQAKARHLGPKLALSLHGSHTEQYTYEGLDEASGRLASGLINFGLKAGDRVALLCEPRPRWAFAFFAAIRAGAIVVPMDTKQTESELDFIMADAKPKFLLVSSSQEKLCQSLMCDQSDTLVLSVEAMDVQTEFESVDKIASHDVRPSVERKEQDVAVITYTSGTMGNSKGVETTFGNLLFQIRAIRSVILNIEHIKTVSILPLSHLFELTAGFLGVLYAGGSICYCNTLLPGEIVAAMRQQKITCMTTVPLFLKLFAGAIRTEINKQSKWKRLLFNVIGHVSFLLPMASRRHLFSQLHGRMGGCLEFFVCGGAPLDIATAKFFERIGLPVYQGYGLAETSPVITTNGPTANRTGSVGKPLPGVEIKISTNGEILSRGPHVMQGYLGNKALTARVIDAAGWLHTGDIGYIDRDGFLYVSGREKNVIVLGSGKKVQPEELEAVLFEDSWIEEGCVVGAIGERGLLEGSEEVCAIVVATEAAVMHCAEHAKNLREFISHVVEQQAQSIAPGNRPTRIYLCEEPLPRTSTRKIRRPQVCKWLNNGGALI
jgi:long-chain acyl-CoA synthetase